MLSFYDCMKLCLCVIRTIETEAYSEPIDQMVVTTELNEYVMVGPNTSKVY